MELKDLVLKHEKCIVERSPGEFVLLDDLYLPFDSKINFISGQKLISSEKKRCTLCCQYILMDDCEDVVFQNVNIFSFICCSRSKNLVFDSSFIKDTTNNADPLVEIIDSENITINNCKFNSRLVNSLILDNVQEVEIKSSEFFNSDRSFLVFKKSKVNIENCLTRQTNSNAIFAEESNIVIKSSEFSKNNYPSIYAKKCKIQLIDSKFHESGQNIVSCNLCEGSVVDCSFNECKFSALSFYKSKMNVSGCKIQNALGNGIYINNSECCIDSCDIMDTVFPGIVTLYSTKNEVTNCNIFRSKYNGISSKLCKQFILKNNVIRDVECGVFISDTSDALLDSNKIEFIGLSAIESLNSSHTVAVNNIINVNGEYAFRSYSGGEIIASKNTITNCQKALAQLTYEGCATITSNVVDDSELPQCETFSCGNYVFADNGQPAKTNIEEEATKLGIQVTHETKEPKLCLKCKKEKREYFFIECGHCVYCKKCAEEALLNEEKCPLCRCKIENVTPCYSSDNNELCTLCEKRKPNAIVLPCGHSGLCCECVHNWISENETCPECRCRKVYFKKIEDRI